MKKEIELLIKEYQQRKKSAEEEIKKLEEEIVKVGLFSEQAEPMAIALDKMRKHKGYLEMFLGDILTCTFVPNESDKSQIPDVDFNYFIDKNGQTSSIDFDNFMEHQFIHKQLVKDIKTPETEFDGFKTVKEANLYLRRQMVLMGKKLSEYIAKDISKSDELFMVWASRGGMGDFHAWPMAIFDSMEKAEKFKKEEDEKAAAIKKKCPCEEKESDAYWDYKAAHGHYIDNFQTDIQKCFINQLI